MLRLLLLLFISFSFIACSDSSTQDAKTEQVTAKEEPTPSPSPKTKKKQKNNPPAPNKPNSAAAPADESVEFVPIERDLKIASDDMVMGNRDAKVVVIEYYSPTCTHCRMYHRWTFPLLKEKYIDTGLIAYVIREFVGNKQDLDAALLMRCKGDQDTYDKFHKILLDKQSQWAYNRNFRDILTNIGQVGGLEPEEYASCLKNQDKLNVLMANTKLIYDMPDFGGTPSFFIGEKRHKRPYSFEELSKAIDAELAKKNVDVEQAIKAHEQASAASAEDKSQPEAKKADQENKQK